MAKRLLHIIVKISVVFAIARDVFLAFFSQFFHFRRDCALETSLSLPTSTLFASRFCNVSPKNAAALFDEPASEFPLINRRDGVEAFFRLKKVKSEGKKEREREPFEEKKKIFEKSPLTFFDFVRYCTCLRGNDG